MPSLRQPPLYHLSAKWRQGQLRQFEMLTRKGDADDRDRQQERKHDMHQGRVKASADEPDDIENYRQTAHAAIGGHYPPAKGRQLQTGEFEALQPEWDAHNGHAQHQAADDVSERG